MRQPRCPTRPRVPGRDLPLNSPAPQGSPCYPGWSGSSGPRASGGPCGSSRSEEGPPWSRPGSFLTKHSLAAWGAGVVPNIHAFQPLFWASSSAWLSASVTSIRFKGKGRQWSVPPQSENSASPQGPSVCVRALAVIFSAPVSQGPASAVTAFVLTMRIRRRPWEASTCLNN